MRVIANVHIELGNAMDRANASLIAAAPDLLAALVWIKNDLSFRPPEAIDPYVFRHITNRIDAAIAKARGE